jgi:hypothetical protein
MTGDAERMATRVALVLTLLVALLGACQPGGEPASTPPAGGPPAEMPRSGANQVVVTLREYEVDMPASIPAGITAFEVANAGSVPHSFRLQGEGTDVSLASDLEPGETAVLEVALEPGSYVVTCPIANHAELGMRVELTVEPRR